MNRNKQIYLEAIRIFAVIGVIFNHTDGFVYYTATDNPITWIYSVTLAIISRTAVPLFFMVTGVLLLEKEESLKELFCKRILRMVLVLFTVSLLYYLFDAGRGRIEEAGLVDFVRRVLSNDIRPSFWFLYEYIFLMLTLPFFRKLAPNLNGVLIIFLVCLRGAASFLVPVLSQICDVSVKFDMGFLEGYIYYALLGYYLGHKGAEFYNRIKPVILWVWLAGFTVLNIGIVYMIYLKSGTYLTEAVDYAVFVTAPVIWLIIRKMTEKLSAEGKISTCIVAVGGCIFGIYLFDNFVRWQLLPVYLFLSKKTVGVLACSVYVVLTFLTGLIYTWILKKIPLMRKIL